MTTQKNIEIGSSYGIAAYMFNNIDDYHNTINTFASLYIEIVANNAKIQNEKRFTIDEIRNYINSQTKESIRDSLSEENIIKANKK